MPEARRRKSRGQSLVEFAISSTVLLLLAMGLIDLSRAFYFSVSLQGAAREGARHGAWYATAARNNPYLDDTDIMTAVVQALSGAGFNMTCSAGQCTSTQVTFVNPGGCLLPTDGNSNNNKPYPASAYPTVPGTANVYICYTNPNNNLYGSVASHPTDNSWKLGDVDVSILYDFQLITPFIQSLFGNTLDLAYNEHFTIQGKP